MRKRRLILLFVVSALFAALSFTGALRQTAASGTAAPHSDTITLLCAGFDRAAENTDVLMLVSIGEGDDGVFILQIPRDTYFRAETAQGKINQLYPYYRSRGYSEKEALGLLTETLSQAFGIRIDGYMALGTDAVARGIDAIGGVRVNVPSPIRHLAPEGNAYIEIPEGERTLNGREAVEFLRFRAGYTEGDIGRVDAQKLLLGAMFRKIKHEVSLPGLLQLIASVYPDVITDASLGDQLSLAKRCFAARKSLAIRLATLPGQATFSEEARGLSYYVVNRVGADALLSRYFNGTGFDASRRMLDEARPHFYNIYYDEHLPYTVYDEAGLGYLSVKTSKK